MRGEIQKITIKRKLIGQGITFPREKTLKGGADSLLIENKTETGNRAGFDVNWRVPAGPFNGGAINRIIEPGESVSKASLKHEFRIAYSFRLEVVDKKRRRRKKRAVLNDPVIIIDP